MRRKLYRVIANSWSLINIAKTCPVQHARTCDEVKSVIRADNVGFRQAVAMRVIAANSASWLQIVQPVVLVLLCRSNVRICGLDDRPLWRSVYISRLSWLITVHACLSLLQLLLDTVVENQRFYANLIFLVDLAVFQTVRFRYRRRRWCWTDFTRLSYFLKSFLLLKEVRVLSINRLLTHSLGFLIACQICHASDQSPLAEVVLLDKHWLTVVNSITIRAWGGLLLL